EIQYLYDKLLYWLYQKENRQKAVPFATRLKPLLRRASPDHDAVFGEECWSLVYELEGDRLQAISFREHEIELIRKLRHASMGSPNAAFGLEGYDISDLSDRYDLLAILYHDAGKLDKAIEDEYIAFLIRREQLQGRRAEIDALLLEGLASGPATP